MGLRRLIPGLRRWRTLGPTEQRQIVAMIDAGASYRAIAREFGITAALIDCALRQHAGRDRS